MYESWEFFVRYEPVEVLASLFVRDAAGVTEIRGWGALPRVLSADDQASFALTLSETAQAEWQGWWETIIPMPSVDDTRSPSPNDQVEKSLANFPALREESQIVLDAAVKWGTQRRAELGSPRGTAPDLEQLPPSRKIGRFMSSNSLDSLTFVELPFEETFGARGQDGICVLSRPLLFNRDAYARWLDEVFGF